MKHLRPRAEIYMTYSRFYIYILMIYMRLHSEHVIYMFICYMCVSFYDVLYDRFCILYKCIL